MYASPVAIPKRRMLGRLDQSHCAGWRHHIVCGTLSMNRIARTIICRLRLIGNREIKGLPSNVRKALRRVQVRRLTYLSVAKLAKLADLCLNVEERKLPGMILETGCALGGSSIVLAAAKSKSRLMKVYDVFGMIPPPSDADGEDVHARYDVICSGGSKGLSGDAYYGYHDNLYEEVIASFKRCGYPIHDNNVELVKGSLQDTLHITEPVALAHIDVDWYDSVYTSLEQIAPSLSPGGAMVIDDYFDWSGCKLAVQDYFKDKDSAFCFDTSARSMIVTRK